jgi:putative nucleotidyltransferase with HDIG domain
VARTSLSSVGAAYLLAVPLAGVAVLAVAALELVASPPPLAWLLLTALTALTGAYTIKIPGLVVRLSVSEPTVFLSTLLFGPAAGAVTAAVDATVMSLRLIPRLRTPHRILFNVGTVAIAVYLAAQLYFRLAGLDMRRPAYGAPDTFVGPLYVFAGGVFAINSWLVAIALGIERGTSPLAIWRRQFLWLFATYLASASIAAILVTFTSTFDWALVGLLLPLVAVSFVAVRTTLGRLEDANLHLGEVNRLYLSTIETLAMAVDAKDQVTHGHIRRVQRFAVELAKQLSLTDDRQIKAIEAAALLHDMGKLAIPEFILNKPGKLTTSEFDVMKTHAALGADILSSIHFPYPVVPIVRHHHENWDGTGYPDGLKGSEIPIGARILSVVDCYDALTSDRPYRPAMTDEQAIDILTQRRGQMYDPLIVDAFVASLSELKAAAALDDTRAVLTPKATDLARASEPAFRQADTAAVMQSLELLACMTPFPPGQSAGSVARDALDRVRRIVPFDTAAIFVLDIDAMELAPIATAGYAEAIVRQLRIPMAGRLTGWVAAYRSSVWNSEAALDIDPQIRPSELVLATSIPLVHNDTVVAVLTAYGKRGQDVSMAQRRTLENLAPSVSAALSDALQRGPQGIDGRRPESQQAAVSALEAALSHSDDSATSAVTLARLRTIASDASLPTTSSMPVVRHLVNGLLRFGLKRQCVVLSDDTCAVYSGEPHSESELRQEFTDLMASAQMQHYALESVTVRNSFDLQIAVRRLLGPDGQDRRVRQRPRIH